MGKHKTNPRRVPCSLADVRRAEREVGSNSMRHALELVLYILLDKHAAPAEDVQDLARELVYTCDLLGQGRLSWNYVHKILKENGVEVRLV